MNRLHNFLLHLFHKPIILWYTTVFVPFLLVQSASAIEFNKRTFAIAEFSKGQDMISVLRESEILESFGISVTIKEDSINHSLYIVERNGKLKLSDFLLELKTYLDIHNKRVFPLFIDYNGLEITLIEELESVDILSKLFYQPPGERWPSEDDIILQNKPLILFNQGKCKTTSSYINSINDHVLGFSLNKIETNSAQSGIWEGKLNNELLLIRRFTKEELKNDVPPKEWNRISLNTYCIDYLIQCWLINGKKPNFIFFSSPNYTRTFHYLTETLKNINSVEGVVFIDGKIATDVGWLHNKQAITNGYFSFPFAQGASFKLAPHKQGYQFLPARVDVDLDKYQNRPIEFTASALNISDGLTASYHFDHSITNLVTKQEEQEQGNIFVNDNEHGVVLKVSNGSFATLRKVEDYKIVNNSFTISIYFKLSEKQDFKEQCVFGSNEEGYCKGLHTVVKYGKILFGFFTNDCKASSKIIPSKWHQLTVRYDIATEIQSIFIDGKKVGKSYNHPPFIGSAELLLGHGIKQNNFMNGYLDDLNIWSRALSDEEIKWLNNNSVKIPNQSWRINNAIAFLLIIIVFIVIAILIIVYRKNKNIKDEKSIKHIKDKFPTENMIYLYGDFSIVDCNGVDYANNFSPKIKELFILLLLRTIENPRGIETGELTKIIWKGFNSDKAANNRGVAFNQLRKILLEVDGVEAVYENKYWRLELADKISCDYQLVKNIFSQQEKDFVKLYNLVVRGVFLQGITKEWILDIQTTHNFDVIDNLLLYAKDLYKKNLLVTSLEILTYILSIDDLNVEALYYQLNCLLKQGNKNKSLFLFERFCERYKLVQLKPFDYDFKYFVKSDEDNLLV